MILCIHSELIIESVKWVLHTQTHTNTHTQSFVKMFLFLLVRLYKEDSSADSMKKR